MSSTRSHPRSTALYRRLLRAYPRPFRERFEDDLVADFSEMLVTETRGVLFCWLNVLADLFTSAPRIRFAGLRPTGAKAHSPHPLRLTTSKGDPVGSSFWFEIRHSLRSLAKAPIYAGVTVALLALGIGANTATFSIVRAVVLESLPFEDSDRLVMLFEGIPEAKLDQLPFSAPDFVDFAGFQTSFESVALFQSMERELSSTGDPERVNVTRATSNLFSTLGAQPALGRVFLPEEDEPGHDVAVLSYGLWQQRFGGSPDVLGRVVVLDRLPFEVVGVMPASFAFPLEGMSEVGGPAEIFLPRAFLPVELQQRGGGYGNDVVARLRPGVTIEAARSELDVLAGRIFEAYPEQLRGYTLTLAATPLREQVVGKIQRPLLLLLAAVGLVLLVVCANVANLALSRAAGRQAEMALRTALGAGRLRLMQSLLIESLLLAILSAAVAIAVAWGTLKVALTILPESLPLTERITLDGTVLGFTALVTLLTTVLFGLAPLLFTDSLRLESAMRNASSKNTGGRNHQRLQRGLVVATVSVAVVLLIGAGLLIRSFTQLVGTEPGFHAQQVLTMSMTLPNQAYQEGPGVRGFMSTVRERVAALPGVERASLSTALPTFTGERRAFTPDVPELPEVPASPSVTWTYGPYFETLGIPLLEGRTLTDADREDSELVVMVSEALAQRYWPGESATGKRLKWGMADSTRPWMRIVGVVGDVNDGPLGSEPNPHIYVPFFQISDAALQAVAQANSSFWRSMHLAVAANGDPTRLTNPVIGEVRRTDPELAVANVQTMDQLLGSSLGAQRFGMMLMSAFAATALILAAVGLYGVLALAVSRRRREIGLRIALGADRTSVTGLVVGQGMRLVILGLGLGILGAAAASRLLQAVLYETAPLDPVAFIAAPAVLLLSALVASFLPAWRASRIEPMKALRTD